jgi:phage gpG-like protein
MSPDQFNDYFEQLPDSIAADAAEIIAETATEYFKESFTRKGFDGQNWQPAKVAKTTGSLLVDTSQLVNSIRPTVVSPERVVISAGNEHVAYAKIHNEGYKGPVTVPAHARVSRKGKPYTVRSHVRIVDIVQRRFMGEARELNDRLRERIEARIQAILNKRK